LGLLVDLVTANVIGGCRDEPNSVVPRYTS